MRFGLLTIAAAAATLMTGCSEMVSLNGFVPDSLAAGNPALPGVWADSDSLYVVKAKGLDYNIAVTPLDGKGATLTFNARLLRAGSAEILDMVPAGEDDPFRVSVHTPVRIWVDAKTLRFTFLDSPWLRERAQLQLAASPVEKRVLLTAPEEAVSRFLLLNGGDDRAYEGKLNELTRQ